MKLAIVGLWHLGTIISAGLSLLNKNKIYCFDEDKIIKKFKEKKLHINEKKIHNIIKKNYDKNIFFSSDLKKLREFDTIWITYDTQINKNDVSDFNLLFKNLKKIFNFLNKKTLILISSQIPIGSIKKLELYDREKLKKKLTFVYIPENLRLGDSLKIFLNSPDIIIGLRNKSEKKKISKVLKGINSKKHFVSIETAEMTKHVINSYLACSIAFINEISKIAKDHKVSFKDLEKSVKTDKRISPYAYLRPGNAFSGGTLARDVNFLINEGKKSSHNTKLLESILISNKIHSQWVEKIIYSQKNFDQMKILQIGLSYTSGTTTLRQSLPYAVFKRLKNFFYIKIYDQFLKKNSIEVEKLKEYFKFNKKKEKFDIVVIFNDDNNFNVIKNFITKKTLIVDINGYYKNICIKNNLKYKSLEYEAS